MFSLVLGAGGTVGMSSHAGVLRALQQAGVEPNDADLMVGTSAGAVISSLVRTGRSVDDMWAMSQGEVTDLWDVDPETRRAMLFTQGWRTPLGLARRAMGSMYVVQRSMVRFPPMPMPVPVPVARWYRGGFVSPRGTRAHLAQILGDEWPERDLRLCTLDLVTGRRLVLGGDRASKLPLHAAARASSAVPGFFEPVRAGRRVLVDGGAHSTTNADVVPASEGDVVIIAAPMAATDGALMPMQSKLARRIPIVTLRREVAGLRKAGAEVLVIAPDTAELATHGARLLRPDDTEAVALAAYDATRRILETARGQRALGAVGNAVERRPVDAPPARCSGRS